MTRKLAETLEKAGESSSEGNRIAAFSPFSEGEKLCANRYLTPNI